MANFDELRAISGGFLRFGGRRSRLAASRPSAGSVVFVLMFCADGLARRCRGRGHLSDRASACAVADSKSAAKNGLPPLGTFRGFQVGRREPDEMGLGPVNAVSERRHAAVGGLMTLAGEN